MSVHPECYGKIFPDVSNLEKNAPTKGSPLVALVESLGFGVNSRTVAVDEALWEQCQACPSYRSCYDLSLAKHALATALNEKH